MRISLGVIEAVEPFVLFLGAPAVAASSAANSLALDVRWAVGGAQTVESVRVVCPSSVVCDYKDSEPAASEPWGLSAHSGRVGVTWSAGAAPAMVELSLAVKVDSNWKVLGPLGNPESHWVRARVNLDGPYSAAAAGHEVRGREEWSSPTVTVVPVAPKAKDSTPFASEVGGVREDETSVPEEKPSPHKSHEASQHPRVVSAGEGLSRPEPDSIKLTEYQQANRGAAEGGSEGESESPPDAIDQWLAKTNVKASGLNEAANELRPREESSKNRHTLMYAAVLTSCVLMGLLYFRKRRLGRSKKWDGSPVQASLTGGV
jgi:hypothetical protein